MMQRPIRKAIFPVAGLGTRFLPASKAIPKEMLPILDRPLIQMVVDEAREAGIEHFVFVTGRSKSVIEDHFDRQYELESILRKRGQSASLELLEKDLPAPGQTSFTRQQEPLGLGHAIWCARHLIADEPFAVLLPDMIMMAKPGCLKQLIDIYHESGGGNVLAVEEVAWDRVDRYGVVVPDAWQDNHFSITGMVEKPKRDAAPSNLIISGRYILQPEVFAELSQQSSGAGGEIQITDAMIRLMGKQPFRGVKYVGTTYDCGDKIGLLSASIVHTLQHETFGSEFRDVLSNIVKKAGGKLTWGSE
jgi:UTP--glucose-1-phosphate uridylyltransferase